MNVALASDSQTKYVCAVLKLNERTPIMVEEFETGEKMKVFQLFFSTSPGYMIQGRDGKLEVITEKFAQLNKYSAQAKCVSTSNPTVYCFCRNLLPKMSKNKK